MAFLESPRFPTGISLGAIGGPGYSTDVVVLNSGHESRNQNWSAARCAYDVARACKTLALKDELIAFFRIAKGRSKGFRFKDWSDYQDGGIGGFSDLGGGQYQMVKTYTHAGGSEVRTIRKPVAGIVVKRSSTTLTEAVDYSINTATGVVTMLGSPTPAAPTSWTGTFDVPVRFDTDQLRMVAEDLEFFRSQSIPIVEIRDEDD